MKKCDLEINKKNSEWSDNFCDNELSEQNVRDVCGGSNEFEVHFATLSNSGIGLDSYGRVLIKDKALSQAVDKY